MSIKISGGFGMQPNWNFIFSRRFEISNRYELILPLMWTYSYSSVYIVRAIKEQEEVRVITSSFSDKGQAAVLDWPVEILRSEIIRATTRAIREKVY